MQQQPIDRDQVYSWVKEIFTAVETLEFCAQAIYNGEVEADAVTIGAHHVLSGVIDSLYSLNSSIDESIGSWPSGAALTDG